jgi:hypothetical protein
MFSLWHCDFDDMIDNLEADRNQMRISSVEEEVVLRIWKSVDPMMTKRKMPKSHGPTADYFSFFYFNIALPVL